jgi:hypothetical protein
VLMSIFETASVIRTALFRGGFSKVAKAITRATIEA